MDPISAQSVLATAGAAGAGGPVYVDDVFSTFLYTGNAADQTITNGIDLSSEGGLVWMKEREGSGSDNHVLVDTERGRLKALKSDASNAETSSSDTYPYIRSFDTTGFTAGYNNSNNYNAAKYASWTFRKAPGFFDVVTWTGNGTNRTIAHNLGSVPGFIIVKRYSNTEDWTCYHRSLGATYAIQLNGSGAAFLLGPAWNNTNPTSTHFTVSTHNRVNTVGEQYVAYLFAHDDQSFGTDSDESIIKCGSYTGSGSSETTVNLGFEPQFVIIKRKLF